MAKPKYILQAIGLLAVIAAAFAVLVFVLYLLGGFLHSLAGIGDNAADGATLIVVVLGGAFLLFVAVAFTASAIEDWHGRQSRIRARGGEHE